MSFIQQGIIDILSTSFSPVIKFFVRGYNWQCCCQDKSSSTFLLFVESQQWWVGCWQVPDDDYLAVEEEVSYEQAERLVHRSLTASRLK